MSPTESFYSLNNDQVIRRVPPPFPPERQELTRALPPPRGGQLNPEPGAMILEWGCGGLQVRSTSFRPAGFSLVMVADFALHTTSWNWEGDRALPTARLDGDIVIRVNASEEAYLRNLEQLAGGIWPGENVTFTFRRVRRQVHVFTGT